MPSSDKTHQADFVCVVQLTDSHIFAKPGQQLLGLDTTTSLDAVIEQVLNEVPEADLMLATGDITQDGSEAGYHRFIDSVARLPVPWDWIPGNHDDASRMAEVGRDRNLNRPWLDLGQWRIVLLDSSLPGHVAGLLNEQQLARLDHALGSADDRHVMVCLHHHPVPIGSEWMEPLGLQNADQLLSRLDADLRVKVVLWGHIHQLLDQQRGHMRLLASPSTCVQFAVGSSDFATDAQPPGFRWLRLYNDGRIDTAVSRLPDGSFLPDASAGGY